MFKKLKSKRGSEVIQNLIVIAVMGAIAVAVFGDIGSKFEDSTDSVNSRVDTLITESISD